MSRFFLKPRLKDKHFSITTQTFTVFFCKSFGCFDYYLRLCELEIQIFKKMSSRINILQTILSSPRTVFNVQSLMMLTGSDDSQKLTKSLHYYVNIGKILNPRRGVYTKLKYNEQEMACSLFRPSYISLEYVLGEAGVVFQWDETISCVSYLSRVVEIADKQYLFRKINPELWIGMEGIEQRDNVAIASAERASWI